MMINKLKVINRGLQILGQPQIASLSENSRGAKAMLAAYDSIVLAELESHTWRFAVQRANLAADATPPLFGKSYRYAIPGDFLCMAPPETNYDEPVKRDWELEGNYILSNDPAPLQLRYVAYGIPESNWSALFAEAVSSSLAEATCEEITNSNTKLNDARGRRQEALNIAKKRNAIQGPPIKQPKSSWITARL